MPLYAVHKSLTRFHTFGQHDATWLYAEANSNKKRPCRRKHIKCALSTHPISRCEKKSETEKMAFKLNYLVLTIVQEANRVWMNGVWCQYSSQRTWNQNIGTRKRNSFQIKFEYQRQQVTRTEVQRMPKNRMFYQQPKFSFGGRKIGRELAKINTMANVVKWRVRQARPTTTTRKRKKYHTDKNHGRVKICLSLKRCHAAAAAKAAATRQRQHQQQTSSSTKYVCQTKKENQSTMELSGKRSLYPIYQR